MRISLLRVCFAFFMTRSGQQSASIISCVDSSQTHLPELQSLPSLIVHCLVRLLFRAIVVKLKRAGLPSSS